MNKMPGKNPLFPLSDIVFTVKLHEFQDSQLKNLKIPKASYTHSCRDIYFLKQELPSNSLFFQTACHIYVSPI